MSIHGICFDNGQSGCCNIICEDFTSGLCEVPDEVITDCCLEYSNDDLMEACELYGIELSEVLKNP